MAKGVGGPDHEGVPIMRRQRLPGLSGPKAPTHRMQRRGWAEDQMAVKG